MDIQPNSVSCPMYVFMFEAFACKNKPHRCIHLRPSDACHHYLDPI